MENYVLAIDSNDASCELLTPRKAVKRKRERERDERGSSSRRTTSSRLTRNMNDGTTFPSTNLKIKFDIFIEIQERGIVLCLVVP